MNLTRSSLIAVAVTAALAVTLTTGCSQQPTAAVAAISDKSYSVTPDSLKVKSGIVAGELTEMKVTERVEAGSGKVTTPAKLSGKLVLKNVSTDQSVRLIGAQVQYIDMAGKLIEMEDKRSAPSIKVGSSYNSNDRLDPGQDTTQSIDAEFPVAALKAKNLREIRLALTYTPTAYKMETLNFAVSIGGQ
jgi:hypothetical protein